MEVIVIDDGINEGYYSTGSLMYNLEFHKNNEVLERKQYNPFLNSHATTCAGIIKKYAPNCCLSSLKVLYGSDGSPDQFLNALDWCIHRAKSPLLINLSIGSSVFRDFDKIGSKISQLLNQGAVIVAALNNNRSYTVPACLSGVIGVATEKNYQGNEYSIETGGFCHADILASSRHQLVDYSGVSRQTRACNSYAAPLITALLHNIIEDTNENNLDVLMKLLSQNGLGGGEQELYFARPDFVFNFSSSGEKNDSKCCKNLFAVPSAEELSRLVRLPGRQRQKVVSHIALNHEIKKELNEKNCLYWTPDFYEQAVRRNVTEEAAFSVPMINLYGDTRLASLTTELCLLFRQENYYARIVSENASDFFYETDWIPKEMSIERFMCFYEKTFECDMILYYSQTAAPPADFSITFAEDKLQCSAEELAEDILLDDTNNMQILAGQLFDVIISYFEH